MSTVTARPISGPEAWQGSDLAKTTDWIRPIPGDEIDEIDRALRAIKARALAWHDIRREEFPLPGFSRDLAAVGHELEHGRGAVLLRGLPVERYSEDELRQVYWGIGSHLGIARFQNARGELIGDVRDELRAYGQVNQPGVEQKPGEPVTSRYNARSGGPPRFHTDRADVVGCSACARRAGRFTSQ